MKAKAGQFLSLHDFIPIVETSTEQNSFLQVPTTQADAKAHHRVCNRILAQDEFMFAMKPLNW
jgi:hypothetical protein